MTKEEFRKRTNDKIEKLYHMAESQLDQATTEQDIETAKRMLIAGLDISIAATRNAIEQAKRDNEFY